MKNKTSLMASIIEDTTPGISVTKKVLATSKASNNGAIKDIGTKMKDYEKQSKTTLKDAITPPKTNYNNEADSEYHSDMEIMNGMEMLRYDSKPTEKFIERNKMAIKGDTKMGNPSDIDNATPKGQGGDPKFGEEMLKRIKRSVIKRNNATPAISQFGDDSEELNVGLNGTKSMVKTALSKKNVAIGENTDVKPTHRPIVPTEKNPESGSKRTYIPDDDSKPAHRPIVPTEQNPIKEDEHNFNTYTHFLVTRDGNKILNGWDYTGLEREDVAEYAKIDIKDMFSDYKPNELKVLTKDGLIKTGIDYNKMSNWVAAKQPEITEAYKMKKLKFTKKINGYENINKFIPESYKINERKFEITDGNEHYVIMWEGDKVSGQPTLISDYAKDKAINEANKINHLINFNPKEKLGRLNSEQRLQENVTLINELKTINEGLHSGGKEFVFGDVKLYVEYDYYEGTTSNGGDDPSQVDINTVIWNGTDITDLFDMFSIRIREQIEEEIM